MYHMIIVDDETAIRRGMCDYIDWNSMGFTVDTDFEDGNEAIEWLKNNETDVVLTDVKMAQVSGLELAKYISQNKPQTKVVIISGYKEFEYARKAIEYNVKYYLLKPIRMDELQSAFGRLRKELDQQADKKEQEAGKRLQMEKILPELQEQFWIGVLAGGMSDPIRLKEKSMALNMNFPMNTPCAVVRVEMSMKEDIVQNYYQQRSNRYNLLNNIFGVDDPRIEYHSVYLSSDDLREIVISRQEMDETLFENFLRDQMEEKTQSVSVILPLQIKTKIEGIFHDITFLAQREEDLGPDAYAGSNLSEEDVRRLQQKYRMFMDLIDSGDFESLEQAVTNLFFELRHIPMPVLRQCMVDLFSMLSAKFMKMSPELWKKEKQQVDYTKLMACKNPKILRETCIDMLREVCGTLEKHQNQVTKSVIERAREYVNENYCEDISLEEIADRYFLNPNYFSRMFRENTGSTFTDYVAALRIKKAQDLLREGKYHVYEVSEMVGYRNEKYFCRVFKQNTGLSPMEFARSAEE